MANLIKKFDGFISLTFLLLLSIFITLYFTAGFAIALSQQRDYVRTNCIVQAAKIQIETLQNVRRLFSLNKKSTQLRISISTTQAALAAATAAGQLQLVAKLTQTLRQLEVTQKNLDLYQKLLINHAQSHLMTKHDSLIRELNLRQKKLARPWQKLIVMLGSFQPLHIPQLAIRPDSIDGIAPNYEWQESAKEKQRLAYHWKMIFHTETKYQRALTWINTLNAQCSVSPNVEKDIWEIEIKVDKLLLK